MNNSRSDNINNSQTSEYINNFNTYFITSSPSEHERTTSLRHLFKRPLCHFVTFMLIALSLPVFAYEDCIISTNGKMTDIKIQDNKVIDVFPLITIMNDKNTLIVHPLKEGKSKFSISKNGKEKVIFDVEVKSEKTLINNVSGFDVLTVDCPPNIYSEMFELDEPPAGLDIDEPPVLRK